MSWYGLRVELFQVTLIKEGGRIRRRFGRNNGIYKRLKNYRRFIRVFEYYSFHIILEYRKIGKILPKCILFLQNMILNRAIYDPLISYDNWQILLVSGSCFHEFEMCYSLCDSFFKFDFTASIKNIMRVDPEIPQKLIFCFIFWLKTC